MLRKPFVVYWNNIPSPYMVERFNVLSDNDKFEFEAWFNDRVQPDRSWIVDESQWRFQFKYIDSMTIAGKQFHCPIPLLRKTKADMLVSLYAEPSFLLGWAIAKLKGIKAGFWVEVTFDSWVKRTIWKEAFKKWLFPRVDYLVTVGKDGKRFSLRYGAQCKRIFFARHGIDVAHFRKGSTIDGVERARLRRDLGLVGTTFIYVGRLLKLKGIDYLLDAFKEVQCRSRSKTSLFLVGDGLDEEFFQKKCEAEAIRNVIFAGFRQKNELPKMYAVSDVFVFPTLGDPYGLVVDEAMACTLPVISTSSAGEIRERVENGINGYIVPPENSHALAEAMLRLANNPPLRNYMGNVSAKKIAGHTPEKWAKDFERMVLYILDHA